MDEEVEEDEEAGKEDEDEVKETEWWENGNGTTVSCDC